MNTHRGKFIVVEGIDRAGKTSQCHRLVQRLQENNISVQYIAFPNRDTQSGKTIDLFLKRKLDLDQREIHLLFAQNRREVQQLIFDALRNGTHVLVDRYAYSGVSYSAAKGLDIEWCKEGDKGHYKPDLVLYLCLQPADAITRTEYGAERFEDLEFQQKVFEMYQQLMENNWVSLDASHSFDSVHDQLYSVVKEIINCDSTSLQTLW